MKRLACLFLLLAFSIPAHADEDLVAGNSALNVATSIATTKIGGGRWYSVQCDGPVYYRACSDVTACTAVSTDPQLKNFDAPVPVYLSSKRQGFAFLKVSAATVCSLFTYTDKG